MTLLRRLVGWLYGFFKQVERKRLAFRRVPVFIQFICCYFLIMLIMFSVLLSVSKRAQQVAMDSYLGQTQRTLEDSATSLERQIENFRSIYFQMNQIEHYQNMRLLKQNNLRNKHHYSLIKLQTLFQQQCFLMEISNKSFVLFTRNGTLITNSRYYINADNYFRGSFIFNDMDSGHDSRQLYDFSTTGGFLPAQLVSVNNEKPTSHFLYLFRPSSESALYGMLVAESDILSLFHISEISPGTKLSIVNQEGEILYSNGEEQKENSSITLESSISSLGLIIEISIPNSYFDELIKPIISLNVMYLVIAVVIGTICSVGFTLLNIRPVQRLMKISSSRTIKRYGNEYQALEQSIRSSITENQELQDQINNSKEIFRANLLTRLLVQESYTDIEEELAKEYLPMLANPCRILCLELVNEEDIPHADVINYRFLEEIRRLIGSSTLYTQISNTQIIILAREGKDTISWMSEIAIKVNESARIYGSYVSAGASEDFSSLEQLHSAYMHAILCMQYVNNDALSIFRSVTHGKEVKNEKLRFSDLNKFHNSILACEADNAHYYLDVMIKTVQQRMVTNDEYKFWLWRLQSAVILILDTICEDEELFPSINNNEYTLSSQPFDSVIFNLKEHVDEIIQALNMKRDAPELELSRKVFEFLRLNYSDASLCLDSVAEYFNVSKSYLYRIMKKTYGTTLSDILENIRMENAKDLLSSTQLGVAEIACACGYNSSNTFYKVFKKRFGISPNTGRNFEQYSYSADEPAIEH